ncbi:mediator of RNA polymerase II transcription subunit 17 [Hydra vulgaris]|uniref:Mediator of RNA polymerase II transcription subunit 17 n=1 Tax=Hydra vulgaris TaxID=6087 RepID=A0ABM4D264_HYDVU
MSFLKISVERLLEQEVEEINRFGEEKYVKPLTLSEELTHNAERIDFYEGQFIDIEDSDKSIDGDKNDVKQKSPWEKIHSKLRISLSEICVLFDVLQCINLKKYLVLDRVSQNPEVPKPTVQMLDKRKLLARAGALISNGAAMLHKEYFQKNHSDVKNIEETEYYSQLMKLRQHWRVKKIGTQIVSDISLKTSGSKFWHPGFVEIKMANQENCEYDKMFSANVSSDILQDSYINIKVIDSKYNIFSETSSTFLFKIVKNTTPIWKQHLMKGQEYLFNKEIFFNLASEAFKVAFPGVEVLNETIKFLIEDAVVIVSLNPYYTDCETTSKKITSYLSTPADNLRLELYQLQFKNYMLNMISHDNNQKQLNNSIFNTLLSSKQNANLSRTSILNEFVDAAKHQVWINRLKKYFIKKSNGLIEPKLVVHWSVISNFSTLASISYFYQTTQTRMLISVAQNEIKINFLDFTVVRLPFDIESLDYVIDLDICNSIADHISLLCQKHRWKSIKYQSPDKNKSQVRYCITAYLPSLNRYLKFVVKEINEVLVEVSSTCKDDNFLLDESFDKVCVSYEQVCWSSIAGETLTEKVESLLIST